MKKLTEKEKKEKVSCWLAWYKFVTACLESEHAEKKKSNEEYFYKQMKNIFKD